MGKSTVAVNLALALREEDVTAGLLDADIYGPSILALLGVEDAPERVEMTDDRRVLPLEVGPAAAHLPTLAPPDRTRSPSPRLAVAGATALLLAVHPPLGTERPSRADGTFRLPDG